MKAIITIDIMNEKFPAAVDFHYSEVDKQIVNINKIDLLFYKHIPEDITAMYFKDDKLQAKINEEIEDSFKEGDYES